MKGQRLTEMMLGKPASVGFHIKDYDRVHKIFLLYLHNYFDTMAKEIYFYRESEFILDITVYLNQNYKHENIRKFMAEDIMDEYWARVSSIKQELDFKREYKKVFYG